MIRKERCRPPPRKGGRSRRRGPYIVAAIAGVAVVGAYAVSTVGQGLGAASGRKCLPGS